MSHHASRGGAFRRRRAFAASVLLCLLAPCAGSAERLPIRLYTGEDGLAGDQITAILQDTRGFLWVAAETGVSRFDGDRFTNYDERDGLPSGLISSLAQTADGSLWLATYGGLARLLERRGADGRAFHTVPLDLGHSRFRPVLLGDPAGGIWLAGMQGLHHAADLVSPVFRRVPLGATPEPVEISALGLGPDGSLWASSDSGLLRRLPDGRVIVYPVSGRPERVVLTDVLCDRDGRVWIATTSGLYSFLPEPVATDAGEASAQEGIAERAVRDPRAARVYYRGDGLPSDAVNSLALSRDGSVWAATGGGLVQFVDGRVARTLGLAQGLAELSVTRLFEDRDGNLWLGTENRGLMRIAAGGFVSYGEADGLANDRIASVFDDPHGRLWVMAASALLHRFDGERFAHVSPPALAHPSVASWGSHELGVLDQDGEWWLPTGEGVLRYAAGVDLERAVPKAVYSEGHGLPGNDVHRIWADSAGELWVSILAQAGPLVRWQRREQRFAVVEEVLERRTEFGAPTAFAEDRAGNLWLGYFPGGLSRRSGARWDFFGEDAGVPEGRVWDLHCDRRGRMWVATSRGGVARIDDPQAAQLRLETYTIDRGLSGNSVDCITEDGRGRLYFGTKHGVDRLDPDNGQVRHFTTQDGLPSSRVHVCHRALDGRLWFGTLRGLASFDPESVKDAAPHEVWLSSVRAGGVPQPVPELGARQVEDLVLRPQASSLQVEFVSLGHALGEVVRYQHRLEGGDSDWSPPSANRSVDYARLAPGSYRFLVRALGTEGTVGEAATVAFRVLPPLWRRGWVLSLAALLVAALVWTLHRARVARVLAVERTRTRIASDLHDDVGSSLSQIALVAELGRMRNTPETLQQIAEDARTLIESTSDIVWSIDPRRDDLESLLVRLRRFGSELLEGRGIRLDFELPDEAQRIELQPELRRELYLLLKEALHNVAKHSSAQRAHVRLEVAAGALRIEVADDGVGFAADQEDAGGRGLHSLRERAARLGGTLQIQAAPGAGTRLRLEVPR